MTTKLTDVLGMLNDEDAPLTAKAIYALADLTEEDQQDLTASWALIPLERRRLLLDRIIEVSETNFDMDFHVVTRVGLTDLDDKIREAAVEATWADETPSLLNRLLPMATIDPSIGVRAAAASALGRFILAGELGKFSKSLARQAENVAIKIYNNPKEDVDVRRRALEALSNCSRPEVNGMIEMAYTKGDERMRISAVYAMGRSYDEHWIPTVMKELKSDNPEMLYEAARAAGELELSQAVPLLGNLLEMEDREITDVVIWSLGEIGGSEAQRYLKDLAELAEDEGDEELSEAVEEALAAASLSGSDLVFDD